MLHTSQGSGYSPLPAAQASPDPFRILVRALVRRPGDYEPMGCLCIYVFMCLFVYVFVCVSNCAFVSLTSYACLYVSLFICVCLCVSMCLCVCLCRCGWCICLCHYVSENPLCVCLPVSTYRCGASLGLTLRGGGLPVHVYRPVSRLDQWYSVERSLVVALSTPTKITTQPFPCICREKRGGDLWRTVTTALLESLYLCLSTHQSPNKVSIYRCRNRG